MMRVLPTNVLGTKELLNLNQELNLPVGVTLTAKVVSVANSQAIIDIAGKRLQVSVPGEQQFSKGAILLLQAQTNNTGEIHLKLLSQPGEFNQFKMNSEQNSLISEELQQTVTNTLIKQGLPPNDVNIAKIVSLCRQFAADYQAPINPQVFAFLLSKEWPVSPITVLMSWLNLDRHSREILLNNLYQAASDPERQANLAKLIMNMETESAPIIAKLLSAKLIQDKTGSPCFPPLNLLGADSLTDVNQISGSKIEMLINTFLKESSLGEVPLPTPTATISTQEQPIQGQFNTFNKTNYPNVDLKQETPETYQTSGAKVEMLPKTLDTELHLSEAFKQGPVIAAGNQEPTVPKLNSPINIVNPDLTANPEKQEKIKHVLKEALNIGRALLADQNQNSNLFSLMVIDSQQQLHELTVEWEEAGPERVDIQPEQVIKLTIPTEHLGEIHMKARIGSKSVRVNLEVATLNVQKYFKEYCQELQDELGPDASISVGLAKNQANPGFSGVNLWL